MYGAVYKYNICHVHLNTFQMFEAAECGTEIVQSLTLLHLRYSRQAIDPHGQPQPVDMPTPHVAFLKDWARKQYALRGITTVESNIAKHFVFENVKSEKKLELFVWTVKEAFRDESAAVRYAFHLRVTAM